MERSEGDARLIEAVSDHVERHLGEIEVVMDEKDSPHDERWRWPLRLLKHLARFPHAEGTWLWEQHTVGSAEDGPLGPGTELCAALVDPARRSSV